MVRIKSTRRSVCLMLRASPPDTNRPRPAGPYSILAGRLRSSRAKPPLCHGSSTGCYSSLGGTSHGCRETLRAWTGRPSPERRAESATGGYRWERRVAGGTRRGWAAVPGVEQRVAPTRVIIGDEHAAVIAASGNLPDELKPVRLLIPPTAHRRLRASGRRLAEGSGPQRGQISGPLMDLAPGVRAAVLDADTRVFGVIPEESLRPLARRAREEAAAAGVHLNQLASEYVAAAGMYRTTIWFGHDRNVPRTLRDGLVPQQVDWRLLSELRNE